MTSLRLSHAQRLLLTSDRSVLAIALDAGFASQARFYAVFKETCDITPAAFRRAGRTMPAEQVGDAGHSNSSTSLGEMPYAYYTNVYLFLSIYWYSSL